jgi:hypothetical protein
MISVDAICEQLISDIETAFFEVERGEGMTLFEGDLEGAGSEADLRFARARDTYATWRDIPDHVIDRYFSALSFLDPQGFRYYIPAFMRFALRHYQDSTSPAIDYAIYHLGQRSVQREHKEARFTVLDESQTGVICRFLRFMAEYTDGNADEAAARQALEGYWGQFCEKIR